MNDKQNELYLRTLYIFQSYGLTVTYCRKQRMLFCHPTIKDSTVKFLRLSSKWMHVNFKLYNVSQLQLLHCNII